MAAAAAEDGDGHAAARKDKITQGIMQDIQCREGRTPPGRFMILKNIDGDSSSMTDSNTYAEATDDLAVKDVSCICNQVKYVHTEK